MYQITLSHGSGGEMTQELIREVFLSGFDNPKLAEMDDSASLGDLAGQWCVTTDSFVVHPLFFPGGDIGRLAVAGTVNDLCMAGAAPVYLTAGFILEEGFGIADLRNIVDSMRQAATEAGVQIVAGDTKVVERGNADGIYINTAGLGRIPPGRRIRGSSARPGDSIIVSGPVGQHGAAILTARGELAIRGRLESDVRPVRRMTEALLRECPETHVLRDPTRGGLATVLNEIARQSAVSITVRESEVPVTRGVRSLCDLLGLDPLYLACEGQLVAFVPWPSASRAVAALRSLEEGREARAVGEVTSRGKGQVVLRTRAGGHRPLPMLAGEPIPRIC